jgi:hypothetical protein
MSKFDKTLKTKSQSVLSYSQSLEKKIILLCWFAGPLVRALAGLTWVVTRII